ncbi:MAG: DUF262 domain-containing protein [Deltaproteobacteria bacterium]|nr:DUF262 domain-containing protein [Deltaproteobacteria bacterium]
MTSLPRANRSHLEAISVEDLLGHVDTGHIRVPRFQRDFKWDQADVIRLLDSIYRGYPVGTLLFWERPRPAEDVRLGARVIPAPERADAWLVLDGQQRVTVLANVLHDPGQDGVTDPVFRVAFDLRSREFVPAGGHEPHVLPLHVLRDFGDLLAWFQLNQADLSHQGAARDLLGRLLGYRLAVHVLRDESEDTAREVFDRMNHSGKALTAVEVFTAAQPGASQVSLPLLAVELEQQGYGVISVEQLMNAIIIADGRDPTRGAAEAARDAARDGAMERVLPATRAAAAFAMDAGMQSLALLPAFSTWIALVRFFHLHPRPHPRNLILLRRWLWRDLYVRAFADDNRTPQRFILASVTTDEDASVQALLERTGANRHPLVLDQKYDPRAADARAALRVLLALEPRALDGHPTRAADVRKKAWANLPRLVPGGLSVANRLLWGPREHDTWADWAQDQDTPTPPAEFLVSHGVTPETWQLLVAGRDEEALRTRRVHLERECQRYVDARAEWEQEDRGPIRLEDEDVGGDCLVA